MPITVLSPPFRRFLAARFVSLFGTSMSTVALAFGVLDASGRAADLGIVLAANLGPGLLLLLVGGAVADRFSRRTVLVVANLGAGLTQAGVAVVLLTGNYHLALVTGLALVNGALEAFASPALRGIVAELVPAADLPKANSLLASTRNAVRIVAPVLAGAVTVAFGGGWAIAVDAGSFLAAAALLAGLPIGTRAPRGRGSLLPDIRHGWREFRARPWVWSTSLSFCLVNLINVGPWMVLGPALVTERGGAAAWGLVLGIRAVGLLAMSVVMYRVVPRRPLRAGALASAFGGLPLIALGTGADLPVLMVCAFVAALGFTVSGVTWETALQQHVPQDVLSRVSSYDDLLSFGAIPVGLLLVGPAADRWGAEAVTLVCGLVFAVAVLLPLTARSVRELGSA
ncbi:MFS transporter [Umezawaea sp. Da 62-37]|uniref:MFS transporter n=1 Tax=Umezawaea sp. Da 62-37 TaxID=3075927 RepID=UPI0028F736DF|nr:MFS transporter [Umezawaea sp. Da 62-37]WNV86353.1 MFS transporter [Umezawaea sp. Da 62-37]